MNRFAIHTLKSSSNDTSTKMSRKNRNHSSGTNESRTLVCFKRAKVSGLQPHFCVCQVQKWQRERAFNGSGLSYPFPFQRMAAAALDTAGLDTFAYRCMMQCCSCSMV